MKFQLFAFVVFLISGFPLDDASKVEDRRMATCQNAGQSCSSNRFKRCCAGSDCVIPALSSFGTCKANCVNAGGVCGGTPFKLCCIGPCQIFGGETLGTCQF